VTAARFEELHGRVAIVLSLCSSTASVVTGHILHCDGGETI
jgi:enoyl-[acyl-carrier-protein] reductase (NADH)